MGTRYLVFLACLFAPSILADYPLPPPSTGTLYVSSFRANEIVAYQPDGNYVDRFSHPDLRGPRGLAISSAGELFCGAQGADRILVFSGDGEYRRQFTGGGLDGPTGLAFSPDGRLYVSSFYSNEVIIFSTAGEHLDTILSENFRGPNCIAFHPDGRHFYVVSQTNARVLVFDENGDELPCFTGGGLSSAMGAAIYEDEIFVTGGSSHNVAVFDLEGQFLRNIVDPEIDGPQGVAFDEYGNFAVSSFYTGRIAYFTRQGERLKVFEEAQIQIARSLAYFPLLAERPFRRADVNLDDKIDISDPISILRLLFRESEGSDLTCEDAVDTNDDGKLNIADATSALGFLFKGDDPPPEPFVGRGHDPTQDALRCY